jgi:hypothetical protein
MIPAVAYSLTEGQWYAVSSILLDETTGSIAADGDISAGADLEAGSLLNLAPQSSQIGSKSGDVWVDDTSGSDKMYRYDPVVAGPVQVVESNYPLTGDLGGTPAGPEVTGIQGRTVATTAPSDGQILAWNNTASEWQPEDPPGGINFTILDNTVGTIAALNSALSTYDIVYLKPGTYTFSDTGIITVSAGKSLIGLSQDFQNNGTYGPELQISAVSSTNRIRLNDSALMSGIQVSCTGTAPVSPPIVYENGCRIVGVNVISSSVANKFAFIYSTSGEMPRQISHCSVENLNGIAIGNSSYNEGGVTEISHCWFTGDSGGGTSYGIYCSALSQKNLHVHHCRFEHYDNGLWLRYTSESKFNDLLFFACNTWAIYEHNVNPPTDNQYSNIWINGNSVSGAQGISIRGLNESLNTIHIENCPGNYGLYAPAGDSRFVDIHVYNCGSSTGSGVFINPTRSIVNGIYANACDCQTGIHLGIGSDFSAANIWAYNCGRTSQPTDRAIFIQSATDASIVGIGARGDGTKGGYGIQAGSLTAVSLAGVTVVNNVATGLYIPNAATSTTIGGLSAYNNGGKGYDLANASDSCRIYGVTSNSNGAADTIGTNWVQDGSQSLAGLSDTDVSSPSGADLLIYDGSDSWDNKALSGDGSLAADGTLTVDGIQGRAVASTAPTDGQVLEWNDTASEWQPSGGGIADPGTKVANDILQYTGASWDAKGAASGDRLTGTIYGASADFSTEVAVGSYLKLRTNRFSLGDQGGSAPVGPGDGDMWYNDSGFQVVDGSIYSLLHSGTSFSGDVTGTSGAVSVDKIRGYAVQDHAPEDGEVLKWVASNSRYEPSTLAAGGKVLQIQSGVRTTAGTTDSQIPNDDTIPQSSEGAEFITATITPTSTTTTLVIRVIAHVDPGTNPAIGALFKDSDSDALSSAYIDNGPAVVMEIRYEMTSGTTSQITFKFRLGTTSGFGDVGINGNETGSRRLGGSLRSYIEIVEYE